MLGAARLSKLRSSRARYRCRRKCKAASSPARPKACRRYRRTNRRADFQLFRDLIKLILRLDRSNFLHLRSAVLPAVVTKGTDGKESFQQAAECDCHRGPDSQSEKTPEANVRSHGLLILPRNRALLRPAKQAVEKHYPESAEAE